MEIHDGYKQCQGPCKLAKPFNEFHKRSNRGDGYAEECKVCKAAYDKEHRAKNKDRINAQRRERRELNKDIINVEAREARKKENP